VKNFIKIKNKFLFVLNLQHMLAHACTQYCKMFTVRVHACPIWNISQIKIITNQTRLTSRIPDPKLSFQSSSPSEFFGSHKKFPFFNIFLFSTLSVFHVLTNYVIAHSAFTPQSTEGEANCSTPRCGLTLNSALQNEKEGETRSDEA
jgi:hypothetical protein